MRRIRKDLLDEVFEAITDITWPPEEAEEQIVTAGLARLRATYARQNALSQPDPFLTEALADFTDDPPEAVDLYRLSLAQSSRYPDEPTHTKRISLASQLVAVGDFPGARVELIEGRAEAERLRDTIWVATADELLAKLTV